MTDKCMKYYYSTPNEIKEYNLDCEPRIFDNINNTKFKNRDMLDFVSDKFVRPFDDKGVISPFTFEESYISQTYDELCNTSSYSLKPQQKFIGQLINPLTNINNMLIYHGLGSGKTCTSLLIGEAFANVKNKETLYVVPAALEQQFEDEIIGEVKNKSIQSCTSMCLIFDTKENKYTRSFYVMYDDKSDKPLDYSTKSALENKLNLDLEIKQLEKYYKDKKEILEKLKEKKDINLTLSTKLEKINTNIARLEKQIKLRQDNIKAKIKKVFTITTHNKFILRLLQFSDSGQVILKEYLQKGSPLFKETTTLIIDEIQNLVSAVGSSYKILYNAIKYYMNTNVRKIFLSATPIYDNAYELALTLNLLQPRIPFPTTKDEFNNMFIGKIEENDGTITCVPRDEKENINYFEACIINKDLLKYMCSGYVSYFKGGNPVAYPYKRVIVLNHIIEGNHKKHYIENLRKDIVQDVLRAINKVGKNLKEGKKDFKGIIIDQTDENIIAGTLTHSRQAINVFFPVDKVTTDTMMDEADISDADKEEAILKARKNALSKLLKGYSQEQVLQNIGDISIKFKSVLDLSLPVNGPIFVYSNWLGYGVEAFATVLDSLGFSKFPKRGPPGKTYFIWSPSVEKDKDIIKSARLTFNSPNNKDGSLIKYMLGTSSIKEGVSFKNISQIHILDPWWNNSRIEQIIARGFRLCSHSDLTPDKRYADVYKHVGVLPDIYSADKAEDPEISAMFSSIFEQFMAIASGRSRDSVPRGIDPIVVKLLNEENQSLIAKTISMVLGSLSWCKQLSIDQKIISVATQKTIINTQFDRVLKSVGVDCEIFKNGNLIRLEENILQMGTDKFKLYYKNPSDLTTFNRQDIPEFINMADIQNRTYSFPNTQELPRIFTEIIFDNYESKFILAEEGQRLTPDDITEDLVLSEDIPCWESNSNLKSLKIDDPKIKTIVENSTQMKELLPKIRIQFLGELKDPNGIKFSDNDRLKKNRILNCMKKMLLDKDLDPTVKTKIKKYTGLFTKYEDFDLKIMAIAKKYGYEGNAEELDSLYKLALTNPQEIEAEYKKIKN